MKKIIICTGLILSFGVFGFGQKQKQQPDAADSNNSKRSTDRGVFLASGTQIDGQLQGAVDVKKSRVGDQVVLKTTKSIKQNGETVVVPRSDIMVNQDTDNKVVVLPEGVSLQALVASLNALGVGPRDIITILQSIKAAGALQADIEVM